MRSLFKKEACFFSIVAVATLAIVTTIWFFTPLPTTAARYTWSEWRAGTIALALDRRDADLAFDIGSYYFGNQVAIGTEAGRPYDLSLARRAFSRAIAIDSSLPLAHYMRARIEFIQSDFGAALTDLATEHAISPDNGRAMYMRGLTYAYRGLPGDLARAEQDFREFVAWAPREWAGYNDLAFVLAKDGQYARAATALEEGIERADGGSENPWLSNALGVMELNLGKYAEAVSALAKAQTLASSLTEAEWQKAYPGNDPRSARVGIEAMQASIARNLATARAGSGE